MNVFVPSKGRAGRAVTVTRLLESGITPNIVVPQDEALKYHSAYPSCPILSCPEKGIGKTRSWILALARARELSRIWILDDDISTLGVRIGTTPRFLAVNWQAAMVRMEAQASAEGWDLVGPMIRQFAWSAKPGIHVNRRVGMFVNLDTGGPWDYWPRFHEDTDMNLQILTRGGKTALFADYAFTSAPMGQNPGGCYDGYRDGHAEKAAQMLVDRWEPSYPGLVKLVVNPRGQTVTKVDWRRFAQ
jgi:hypothetical protein